MLSVKSIWDSVSVITESEDKVSDNEFGFKKWLKNCYRG